MNSTTERKAELVKEIATLEKVEHCLETNEGTYGAVEACRKVGDDQPMAKGQLVKGLKRIIGWITNRDE